MALNTAMNKSRWKSRLMISRTIYSRTTFYLEYWVHTTYKDEETYEWALWMATIKLPGYGSGLQWNLKCFLWGILISSGKRYYITCKKKKQMSFPFPWTCIHTDESTLSPNHSVLPRQASDPSPHVTHFSSEWFSRNRNSVLKEHSSSTQTLPQQEYLCYMCWYKQINYSLFIIFRWWTWFTLSGNISEKLLTTFLNA